MLQPGQGLGFEKRKKINIEFKNLTRNRRKRKEEENLIKREKGVLFGGICSWRYKDVWGIFEEGANQKKTGARNITVDA